jgi:hypothetical protein
MQNEVSKPTEIYAENIKLFNGLSCCRVGNIGLALICFNLYGPC